MTPPLTPDRAREIVEQIAALAKEAGVKAVILDLMEDRAGLDLLAAAGAPVKVADWRHGYAPEMLVRPHKAALVLDGVRLDAHHEETRRIDLAVLARAIAAATEAA